MWREILPLSCSVGERKIMNHFVVKLFFAYLAAQWFPSSHFHQSV